MSREFWIGAGLSFAAAVMGVLAYEYRKFTMGAAAASAPATSGWQILRAVGGICALFGIIFLVASISPSPEPHPVRPEENGNPPHPPPNTGTPATATIIVPAPRPVSEQRLVSTIKGCSLVYVPEGHCQLGCDRNSSRCAKDEAPSRTVEIRVPFKIMLTEVTNAQYQRCVAESNCEPLDSYIAADQPVVDVTAIEANKFCEWLGGRLPKQSEWEYAARSGDGNVQYPWGAVFDQDSVVGGGLSAPLAVKSRPPNKLGLFDMSGNVAEYAFEPASESGRMTMYVCGGSFRSSAEQLRVSYRVRTDLDTSGDAVGFRCVIASGELEKGYGR